MGRIYTTKMALRKALITVRLTIEPESGTPAPPSWLESQGEKYTPGWRHQTQRVAAGRSRLSRSPAVYHVINERGEIAVSTAAEQALGFKRSLLASERFYQRSLSGSSPVIP